MNLNDLDYLNAQRRAEDLLNEARLLRLIREAQAGQREAHPQRESSLLRRVLMAIRPQRSATHTDTAPSGLS